MNVLELGIRGDGIADDAPALQNLLNVGSLEIYLPGGRDYHLGDGLLINQPVTIRMGQGAAFTKGFVSTPMFTINTTYGNVILEGIIDTGRYLGTFVELAEGESVYNLTVRGCTTHNGNIIARGTVKGRLVIEDNEIGTGSDTRIIAVVPGEQDYVQHSIIKGNRLFGDGVAGSSKNGHITTGRNIKSALIECNESYSSGGDGFDLDGGLQNAIIRHNHVSDAQRAGYEIKPGSNENGTANLVVTGNYAIRCGLESGSAGYSLKASGIYSDNYAIDCQKRGVYVSGDGQMSLGPFFVTGCEQGIWIQSAPRGVILRGCVVDGADIGIAILAGGDWRNVSDCRVTNCITGVSWSNTPEYPAQHGVVQGCYIEAQYPITKMDGVELEEFGNYLIEVT